MKPTLFLNGAYVDVDQSYELFHPHSEEKLADIADSSEKDMKEAIDAAQKGFEKMKTLSSRERGEILSKAAALLSERHEEAAQTISKEASKPITAARGEVGRTVQTLQFSAEEAKRLEGEYIALDAATGGENRDAFTIREPLGVIGAITPFNFPLNLTAHKVGPALAAGNSIVVKPGEQTPLSSFLLAEVLTDAGAPGGSINVVPGDGPKLGKVLLEDERIKKISFTGSPEVGKLIKRQAGLKKVTLELGSNAAMYVDESAQASLDQVVQKAVAGAFGYNGQVCLSTQRIYVHGAVFEAFKDKFVNQTQDVVFGDPTDDKTVVTSLINKKAQQRILDWLKEAKADGTQVLTGGKAQANGITPTVLTNVHPEAKVSCQEIFGPVVIIEKVNDHREAVGLINHSRYGLNAGIFTNDLKQGMTMAHEIHVGQVLINDVPTLRFDHMPYGGVKDSGYGREGVKYAIEEMTELKMISINYA